MSRLRIFGLVVALLLVMVFMAGAGGYVVILKSGHKIRCKEPMTIQGTNAIITLATGAVASYPLQLIDLVETERYNQLGLGDAVMIEQLTTEGEIKPTATPRTALGSYTSIDASGIASGAAVLGSTEEPTPTPTPGIQLNNAKYHDERIDQAFGKVFDEKDLLIYRTSQGTSPEYFFIQTTTDSEREVFQALETVAQAYVLIHKLHAEIAPKAVELQMIQTSGKPAGTFRFTPELAQELASGETPTQTFYIKNVIF
jgi:hypothetical protein